jgi:hypothetical protein
MPDEPMMSFHIEGLSELEARWSAANYVVRGVMAERGASLSESTRLVWRIHAPVGKDDPLGRPRKTPHLRDSIDAAVEMTEHTMTLTVGVPDEQAQKVEWLRHGTRDSGTITPKNSRALHFWWFRAGVEVFAASVEHKGMAANHWEDDAYDDTEALVEEAGLTMGDEIAKAL